MAVDCFTHLQQTALLTLARETIAQAAMTGAKASRPITEDPQLQITRACFVTLTKGGDLRGCIGTLEPYRLLMEDICGNAYRAAFSDPRFPQVTHDELGELHICLSILGPLEPLVCRDEQDLLTQLVPFEDGVVLQEGMRKGTFLPSVWESLPHPCDFIAELKCKAGMSADYWSDTLQCFRYHTLVLAE